MHCAVVTGGRNHYPSQAKQEQFAALCAQKGIELVLVGGASGVDECIADLCQHVGISYTIVPALWAKHQRSAGPRRNQLMIGIAHLLDAKPLGIAFPGGKGTEDMVSRFHDTAMEIYDMTLEG